METVIADTGFIVALINISDSKYCYLELSFIL